MYKISKGNIVVECDENPFQISSIKYKNEELIYQKNQKWKWSFPMMIPMCTLPYGKRTNKSNPYINDNKKYDLMFHGFARHNKWDLLDKKSDEISVSQLHKADQQFPWSFKVIFNIKIVKNNVNVKFELTNLSNTKMYYSTGLHPGYLLKGNDFIKINNIDKYNFYSSDLFLNNKNKEPIDINSNKISIKKDLNFNKYDTLVGRKTENISFSLINDLYTLNFKTNFNRLWIWQEDNNANYVCLEPTDISPPDKEGIHEIKDRKEISILDKNETTKRIYDMEIVSN